MSQDLLPTPRATEIVEHPAKQAQRLGDRTGTKLNNLSSGAAFGLLPTPTAIDSGSGRVNRSPSPGAAERPTIAMAARMGLLPTPTVMEDRRKPNGNPARDAKLLTNLNPYSIRVLYPTPLATDIAHPERVRELKEAGGDTFFSRKNGETRPNGLTDFLDFHGLIPTPTARLDGRDSQGQERREKQDSELKHLVARRIGHASQLNPLFVAEMMGFPLPYLIKPFIKEIEWINLD